MGSYRVGLDVSLELEFRMPWSNGVPLAVSSQVDTKMEGLGIELHNGKVHTNIEYNNALLSRTHFILTRLYNLLL